MSESLRTGTAVHETPRPDDAGSAQGSLGSLPLVDLLAGIEPLRLPTESTLDQDQIESTPSVDTPAPIDRAWQEAYAALQPAFKSVNVVYHADGFEYTIRPSADRLAPTPFNTGTFMPYGSNNAATRRGETPVISRIHMPSDDKWSKVPLPRHEPGIRDVAALLSQVVSRGLAKQAAPQLARAKGYIAEVATAAHKRYKIFRTVADPVLEPMREVALRFTQDVRDDLHHAQALTSAVRDIAADRIATIRRIHRTDSQQLADIRTAYPDLARHRHLNSLMVDGAAEYHAARYDMYGKMAYQAADGLLEIGSILFPHFPDINRQTVAKAWASREVFISRVVDNAAAGLQALLGLPRHGYEVFEQSPAESLQITGSELLLGELNSPREEYVDHEGIAKHNPSFNPLRDGVEPNPPHEQLPQEWERQATSGTTPQQPAAKPNVIQFPTAATGLHPLPLQPGRFSVHEAFAAIDREIAAQQAAATTEASSLVDASALPGWIQSDQLFAAAHIADDAHLGEAIASANDDRETDALPLPDITAHLADKEMLVQGIEDFLLQAETELDTTPSAPRLPVVSAETEIAVDIRDFLPEEQTAEPVHTIPEQPDKTGETTEQPAAEPILPTEEVAVGTEAPVVSDDTADTTTDQNLAIDSEHEAVAAIITHLRSTLEKIDMAAIPAMRRTRVLSEAHAAVEELRRSPELQNLIAHEEQTDIGMSRLKLRTAAALATLDPSTTQIGATARRALTEYLQERDSQRTKYEETTLIIPAIVHDDPIADELTTDMPLVSPATWLADDEAQSGQTPADNRQYVEQCVSMLVRSLSRQSMEMSENQPIAINPSKGALHAAEEVIDDLRLVGYEHLLEHAMQVTGDIELDWFKYRLAFAMQHELPGVSEHDMHKLAILATISHMQDVVTSHAANTSAIQPANATTPDFLIEPDTSADTFTPPPQSAILHHAPTNGRGDDARQRMRRMFNLDRRSQDAPPTTETPPHNTKQTVNKGSPGIGSTARAPQRAKVGALKNNW